MANVKKALAKDGVSIIPRSFGTARKKTLGNPVSESVILVPDSIVPLTCFEASGIQFTWTHHVGIDSPATHILVYTYTSLSIRHCCD